MRTINIRSWDATITLLMNPHKLGYRSIAHTPGATTAMRVSTPSKSREPRERTPKNCKNEGIVVDIYMICIIMYINTDMIYIYRYVYDIYIDMTICQK